LTGWQDASRDPDTDAPRPDPERFPNGIKAVSDQVHALGLKVICSESFCRDGYLKFFDVRLAYTAVRAGIRQGNPRSGSVLTGINRYTCGGRFGSLGYEVIDANTYAEWEIDYLSEI